MIEADEEDEEVENVESNVGNDNAVSKGSMSVLSACLIQQNPWHYTFIVA